MTLEQIGLLISFGALIATLIGWGITYRQKQALQRRAREYEIRDRQLDERKGMVKMAAGLVSHLVSAAWYYEMAGTLNEQGAGSEQIQEYLVKAFDALLTGSQIVHGPIFSASLRHLSNQKKEDILSATERWAETAEQMEAQAPKPPTEFTREEARQFSADVRHFVEAFSSAYAELDTGDE